jgi:hypothetical protein
MNFRFGIMGLLLVFIVSVCFAEPWDFLRAPINWIELVSPAVVWLMLVVSAVIFCIAILALKKKYSQKLLFVAAAFGLFFLKSLLIVIDQYVSPGNFLNYGIQAFFDLLTIGCLFIALFWK